MARKADRKHLTDAEFNALSTLTMHTKLDNSFDVCQKKNGEDAFRDFDENKTISLRKGLELLYDCIAYPLRHERLTETQGKLIVGLFREFKIGTEDGYEWLLGEDTDGFEWLSE